MKNTTSFIYEVFQFGKSIGKTSVNLGTVAEIEQALQKRYYGQIKKFDHLKKTADI
jgi:hypothetical protein